jgi:hypothetical protein
MWVYDIHHVNDTMVQVRYLDTTTGTPHALLASRVIMATPVNIGAKIISDLPEQQKAVMQSVEHMHYLVHNVHTPLSYFHASYDTWTADVSFTVCVRLGSARLVACLLPVACLLLACCSLLLVVMFLL